MSVWLALLDSYEVSRWDGFHGVHPKNVCDGTMFDFVAIVNGGERIRADGSENFPDGYDAFARELDRLLNENEY